MVSVTVIQLCHLGMKATKYNTWLSKAVILDMLFCFLFSFSGENLMGFYQNSLLLFTVKGKDLAKMTFQPDNSRSSNFVIFTKMIRNIGLYFWSSASSLSWCLSPFPVLVPIISVQVNLNYIPRSSFLVWDFVLERS